MIHSLPALKRQFVADGKTFFQFDSDDPRRTRALSLAHLKKQAKTLLKQLKAGDAWARLQAVRPGIKQNAAEVCLADAQLVVARENGFASWPRLKHHIEAVAVSQQALADGEPTALDADRRTLHIRCGNDIMYKLAVAGFVGDFLSFADPYIQGPVPASASLAEFIQIRADFLAAPNSSTAEAIRDDLSTAYHALDEAHRYQRIVFWFENDAYDVLVFLKLLHFFSDRSRRAPDMRFLCIDEYPGVKRFNGIGQLPPEAMRVLWESLRPINDAQYEYGKRLWEGYTAKTPETFAQLAWQSESPLPEIVPALRRHLQELPWTSDGLSLTERLTLQILSDHGPQNAARLFYHWYTVIYEPLVYLGDSSYWIYLDALASAEHPAIAIRKDSSKKIDWHVSLTDYGNALLEGAAHWTTDNAYDRWFGGVHNASTDRLWLWDDQQHAVRPG